MYISLIPVPEDEIAAGEKKFTERMALVMNDPWGFINKDKAKLTSTIERVWPVNLEHMDDFELWRYVYIDKMDLVHASEQYHFMVMRGLSSAFALFRQLCAELFGIRPHDITFAELMSGYDNSIFQVNKVIAELATRAVALKVDDSLRLPDREALVAMEQSQTGREWLRALRSFIQIHGLRQVSALWDYNSLT
jgi:hypothetical protein